MASFLPAGGGGNKQNDLQKQQRKQMEEQMDAQGLGSNSSMHIGAPPNWNRLTQTYDGGGGGVGGGGGGGAGGGAGGGGGSMANASYSSSPTPLGSSVPLMPSARGWTVNKDEQDAARAKYGPNSTAGVSPGGVGTNNYDWRSAQGGNVPGDWRFGGGGGGSGGGGGGGGAIPGGGIPTSPAPGPLTNTAERSPDLQWLQDKYKSRFDVDNTRRAIDRSNLGIADAAALTAADARGQMAQRGVLNTGAGDTFLNKRVFGPAQRQAAEQAANISMGRERDLDNMTLQGLGIMRSQDDVNLANRGLGLQQYGMQQQGDLARQEMAMRQAQLEQQRRDSELSRWMALMQM